MPCAGAVWRSLFLAMCAAASPAEGRAEGAIEARIELNGQTIDLAVPLGRYDAKMTPDVEDKKFSMENEGNHDHGELPLLQSNEYDEVKQALRVRSRNGPDGPRTRDAHHRPPSATACPPPQETQRRINATLSDHIAREEEKGPGALTCSRVGAPRTAADCDARPRAAKKTERSAALSEVPPTDAEAAKRVRKE